MPSTRSCTHNFDFNHVIFDSAHVASLATAFAGIPGLNSTGRTADDNGLKPDGSSACVPPVGLHDGSSFAVGAVSRFSSEETSGRDTAPPYTGAV